MERLLPILSGSLRDIIKSIIDKTSDPIAEEIYKVDSIVNNINDIYYALNPYTSEALVKELDSLITDEVRMLTVRIGEFEISFLPKGKEAEYNGRDWSRKNRQTGKPTRIFQKLIKREFKTREWEIFNNLFRAELCQCNNFEIVEGEDIRYWYLDEHYYRCDGTLGNSCMRYEQAQPYFDIYVDKAKMLITKKDDLLTGRALIWEIDGVTILDRIYTCFDYLENCFIDYAKEHGWWIRETNSLLSTGETQWWYTPDDDYKNCTDREFVLELDKGYEYFPYMDSFRYYNGDCKLSTHPVYNVALDSTDGNWDSCEWECDQCGRTFYSYSSEETPDELHWSDWNDCYLCDDCCWYSDGLNDYISNNEYCVEIHGSYGTSLYPESYLDDYFIEQPTGEETRNDIVKIDEDYYFVTNNIKWNDETKMYEV